MPPQKFLSSMISATSSRANHTPGSRIATGCNMLVAQARLCSSFRLTHMSREDHAQSIESAMAAKGKTRNCCSTHNFAPAKHGEFRCVSVGKQESL